MDVSPPCGRSARARVARDPLGKRLGLGREERDVLGVLADIKQQQLDSSAAAANLCACFAAADAFDGRRVSRAFRGDDALAG